MGGCGLSAGSTSDRDKRGRLRPWCRINRQAGRTNQQDKHTHCHLAGSFLSLPSIAHPSTKPASPAGPTTSPTSLPTHDLLSSFPRWTGFSTNFFCTSSTSSMSSSTPFTHTSSKTSSFATVHSSAIVRNSKSKTFKNYKSVSKWGQEPRARTSQRGQCGGKKGEDEKEPAWRWRQYGGAVVMAVTRKKQDAGRQCVDQRELETVVAYLSLN